MIKFQHLKKKFRRKLYGFWYQAFELCLSLYNDFQSLQMIFSSLATIFPFGCSRKIMFSKSPFKNVILKSIWNTSKSHTITLAINTLIEVSLTTTAKILLKSRPCFYDNIWPLVVLCDVQLPFEHFFGFEKHNPIALRYSFDNLDNIYILFLFRDSIFFSTITFH